MIGLFVLKELANQGHLINHFIIQLLVSSYLWSTIYRATVRLCSHFGRCDIFHLWKLNMKLTYNPKSNSASEYLTKDYFAPCVMLNDGFSEVIR